MLKAILLVVSGMAVSGCAGDRKSTGLVANPQSDTAVAGGTSYALQFSSINPALDGSGKTAVSVKLKSGNVVVTDGDLAKVTVTLKYRVNNPEGEDYFEVFAAGGKRKLTRGATTFNVRLEAGEVHQLQAETVVNDRQVSGKSGIFPVPQGDETEVSEDSL